MNLRISYLDDFSIDESERLEEVALFAPFQHLLRAVHEEKGVLKTQNDQHISQNAFATFSHTQIFPPVLYPHLLVHVLRLRVPELVVIAKVEIHCCLLIVDALKNKIRKNSR